MRYALLILLVASLPAVASADEIAVVFSYEGSDLTALFATPASRTASEKQVAEGIVTELARHVRYWKFTETALPPPGLHIRSHLEQEGNRYELVLEIYREGMLSQELWRAQLYEPQFIALRGLPLLTKVPEDVGRCLRKDFPRDLRRLKEALKMKFPLTKEASLKSPPYALLRLAWPTYCSLAASTFRIVGKRQAGSSIELSSTGTRRVGLWPASAEEVLMVEHTHMNGQTLRKQDFANIRTLQPLQIWLETIKDEDSPCELQVAL